jgi:hypothetical protein
MNAWRGSDHIRSFVMHSPSSGQMNDRDPQAWLADVLARMAGHPASGKCDEPDRSKTPPLRCLPKICL